MGVITSKHASAAGGGGENNGGVAHQNGGGGGGGGHHAFQQRVGIGRRLFGGGKGSNSASSNNNNKNNNAATERSSVLVVTEGDGADDAAVRNGGPDASLPPAPVVVPRLVCPEGEEEEGGGYGGNVETATVRTKSTISVDSEGEEEENGGRERRQQSPYLKRKRDCFRTVSDPGGFNRPQTSGGGGPEVAVEASLPGEIPRPSAAGVGGDPTFKPMLLSMVPPGAKKKGGGGDKLDGSTCPGKMAPFFHPGLWPLAATVSAAPTSAGGGLAPHGGGGLLGTGASAAATARSTGCIVSALAAADPDRPFLLHPAMSNANLSAASRLRPREVTGREGDVFAHPAVVSPGGLGALKREEMGEIGFGAIERAAAAAGGDATRFEYPDVAREQNEDDEKADREKEEEDSEEEEVREEDPELETGGTWAPKAGPLSGRKKGAKLERQISLIDIEFEEVEIFPGVSAAEGHSPSSSLHRHWGNCSSNNNASSSRKSSAASSLNSLAGALDAGSRRARERSNSGLYKRHSFGTKGDRKSTSVDNFLAVTDYGGGGGGGGTLRANRSSGGGLGHSQGKSASRGGGGGKSFGEAFAASLSFKQPLMALKKLRPGVAAAASAVVSGGGGGKKRGSSSVENFADLTALSQADGMPKKDNPSPTKNGAGKWLARHTTLPAIATRKYRVGAEEPGKD